MTDEGRSRSFQSGRDSSSDFRIDASCFEDEATGKLVALVTKEVLLSASLGSIDLAALDGVTFTWDFERTSAALQYVPQGKVLLERSSVPEVLDMGRTVPVKHSHGLRFHIIFRAGLGMLALSTDPDAQEHVHLCIAHEAAHVDHEANLERKFPELYAAGPIDCGDRARQTFLHAIDVWSEYAACRSSAFFQPSALNGFEDTFCRALLTSVQRSKERIAEYRSGGDALRAFQDIQKIFGELFVDAGYFLGHLDGIEGNLESASPRAAELLSKQPTTRELIQRLRRKLREMWLSEYGWGSLEVFAPIYEILRDMMDLHGVVFACCGDEWRLALPGDEQDTEKPYRANAPWPGAKDKSS